jgi:hypothetical protein
VLGRFPWKNSTNKGSTIEFIIEETHNIYASKTSNREFQWSNPLNSDFGRVSVSSMENCFETWTSFPIKGKVFFNIQFEDHALEKILTWGPWFFSSGYPLDINVFSKPIKAIEWSSMD